MTKPKLQKVPISERALLARVNRSLAKDDRVVRKSRVLIDRGRPGSEPYFNPATGEFYMIDTRFNGMVEDHIDLEDLGREIEVLKPWETLA